jgi:CheY-like chemotaxis protein
VTNPKIVLESHKDGTSWPNLWYATSTNLIPVDHVGTATLTILIIEDDQTIQTMLTEILRDEGYSVVCAANGVEALMYVQQHELPQLILLDLNMPEMNGWAFRAEQQRDAALAAIPVIIISALPNLDLQAAALKAIDWISKPIDISTLIGKVARYYQ